MHGVAAYARQSGTVTGRRASQGKGRELAAVTALLELLPLEGRVVAGDAQFTVERVVTRKGQDDAGGCLCGDQPAAPAGRRAAAAPTLAMALGY